MKKLNKIDLPNFISHNGTIFDIELTYEKFGQPLGDAPVVLVNHALTGNSTVTGKNGWWNQLIGDEKLIDTKTYSVLAFNFPGNGYGSKLIANYSDLILRDIAKIFLIGLDKLNIKTLFAIIGGSIGGSLIWEMAAISPSLCKNLIPIACDWKSNDWVKANQKVVLATVIQTWGSSPRQVGSRMIVNETGDFSGSVSGGCVESAVVRECIGLIKDNKPCKKIEFKVSNESAWEVGLACGGEIAVYLEQIN